VGSAGPRHWWGFPQTLPTKCRTQLRVSTTTALDSRILLGDFSSYYIIRRVGMLVSYVPHLFGVTNGRPLGANGWYCHFRTGAKPVSDKAFVELVDKTSA
jgi:predicted phage gp36 major capsid-like protein